MDLLQSMGLVIEKNGRIIGATDFVISPAGVPSSAVRTYHGQILAKALQALELQSVSEREFSGVGFAVSPRSLPAIKQEISDFQDKILAKYSKGNRQEVYFLETVLFKLTQGNMGWAWFKSNSNIPNYLLRKPMSNHRSDLVEISKSQLIKRPSTHEHLQSLMPQHAFSPLLFLSPEINSLRFIFTKRSIVHYHQSTVKTKIQFHISLWL